MADQPADEDPPILLESEEDPLLYPWLQEPWLSLSTEASDAVSENDWLYPFELWLPFSTETSDAVSEQQLPDVQAPFELPGPIVAQELLPGPIVAQELLPGPIVAQELLPGPIVAQELLPGPIVAQELLPSLSDAQPHERLGPILAKKFLLATLKHCGQKKHQRRFDPRRQLGPSKYPNLLRANHKRFRSMLKQPGPTNCSQRQRHR
ncbi:hypothetical protein BOX15_Mlig021094g1 [Macrostomum lignano]|uniref:Uncharacterized protein n=1 Tax=Macrostomum lignano TaxID=282301 RepID=A0A267GUD0_9PLAT|nr:hypothetical protein BOX15_Mlig021094g1 [Macrostomum lignano]